MWLDYDERYRRVAGDPKFLLWRKEGARHKARNIAAVCEGLAIHSVIEIGCGTGAVLGELMDLKFASAYAGTDVSAAALGAANAALGREFRGGFVADAKALPVADKTFSVAVLSHVLEHLQDPAQAALEASRVADFIVAEVPTEEVLTNWVRQKILQRDYASIEEAGHVQFWSARSFVQFLHNQCDFEVLSLRRNAVSAKEDFFGKEGAKKLKPLVKHLIQAMLPSFLRIWVFTTHTTALCRPAHIASERPAHTIPSRCPAQSSEARPSTA
ncbi:MAG TPA: class I SAM-dependent methyltransferase [Candidatus Acidoferrales bacterium]|nr:class I SAM-dependent methyltransferase [Candidatus Acidoferrales bacterium]